MKKFLKNRVSLIIPVALFLSTFFLYVHHISPSVFAGDSGDFLGAIAVRGIPHPSGYPLYVLLGIITSYLPTAQPLAWNVGIISAFFSALSVVLMYLIVLQLLKNKYIATITALTLAFTYPFWLYAEVVEVFALAYFFVLLLFYIVLVYYQTKHRGILYLFSFCLGLAFANHEITLLLLPALGFMILRTNWKIFISPKILGICLLLVILGLFPYVYIPIAASQNPPLNWNDASNLENFIQLVMRQDYGWIVKDVKPKEHLTGSLLAYVLYWQQQLSIFLIGVSFIGIVWLLLKRKYFLFSMLFLSFFLFGPFFIEYGSIPLVSVFQYGVFERFYVLSYLFFLLFFACGLVGLVDAFLYLYKKTHMSFYGVRVLSSVLYGVFFLIPFLLFLQNYKKTDLHNVMLGEEFTRDFLVSLPKNSYSLWSGDTLLFNSIYLRHAEKVRKDVIFITPRDLRELEKSNKIFQGVEKEIKKKNKGIAEDTTRLLAFILLQKDQPVTLNFVSGFQKNGYGLISSVPHGITYRVLPSKRPLPSKEEFLSLQKSIWSNFTIQPDILRNAYGHLPFLYLEIPYMYAQGAVNVGDYFIDEYGDFEEAKKWYDKALAYEPSIFQVNKGLGYYYIQKKECRLAEQHLQKYLSRNTYSSSTWLLLYTTYKDCLKDEKKAKNVEKIIKKMFQSDVRKKVTTAETN